MNAVLLELRDDILSSRCVTALALGLVMGVLLVVVEVSFAAMIFSGPLAALATRGAGLTLFGALVLCLIMALTSSFRSSIVLPQDSPVAVLAGMGSGVAALMGMAAPEDTFMTLVAGLGLTSVCAGLTFALIGWLRQTNFFRFIPYPVVGGFLAGSGWLLTMGGISVMGGISPSWDALPALLSATSLWKWGPGLAYAVVLLAVMKRWSHFMLLPVSIVAFTLVYYAAFAALGMSVTEAREAGILLSGVPASGLWPAFSPADLAAVHWDVLLTQLPVMGTAVLVGLICLLLNLSGLELGGGEDLDFNREFRNVGLANVAAGLGGSTPGMHTLSLSLLCRLNGAYTRLVGLATAAVVGMVLFAGGAVLEFFPLPVLGGLLVFIGLDILDSWLLASRRKLPALDYAVLLVIFLVVCSTGFLEGVGIGLVLTVIMFVIRFSQIDVIERRFNAQSAHSRTVRPIPHRVILRTHGDRLQGYALKGYMFFGSASSLGERLKAGLAAAPAPWCVLLDCTGVTGFDVSAANVFQRFFLAARNADVRVVLATSSPALMDMFARVLPADVLAGLSVFEDADRALEECEDYLVTRHEGCAQDEAVPHEDVFEQSVDDVLAHLDRQVHFEELTAALAPWVQEKVYDPGEMIVARGEAAGMHLLVWGTATTRSADTGVRVAHHGVGDVLAVRAAFGAVPSGDQVLADEQCRTLLLTSEARSLLESERPDLALKLDRHILAV